MQNSRKKISKESMVQPRNVTRYCIYCKHKTKLAVPVSQMKNTPCNLCLIVRGKPSWEDENEN